MIKNKIEHFILYILDIEMNLQEHPLTKNLQDSLRGEELINESRQLTGYIGFAPTGELHIGYLVPLIKVTDITKLGHKMIIMIADLHGILDARKMPTELRNARVKYYQEGLTCILKMLGVDLNLIEFVVGSQFQCTLEYRLREMELKNTVSCKDCIHAGTEVIKADKHPRASATDYPVMQAIDQEFVHPHIDFELGGIDQRKLFMFATENIKRKISYLMTPVISLSGKTKMSASATPGNIRVLFTDSAEIIRTSLMKSYFTGQDTDGIVILHKLLCECLGTSPILIDSNLRETKEKIIDKYIEFITSVAEEMKKHNISQLISDAYP